MINKANLITQYETKFVQVREVIHNKDVTISDLQSEI